MRTRFFVLLLLGLWWFTGMPGTAAETNGVLAELGNLVGRINQKLQHGQTNETDFTNEIGEFDALVAQHKGGKDRELAQVLAVKGQLYYQVFGRPDKTLEVFKQIKADYPNVQLNGGTDEAIRLLERVVAAEKVQRTLIPGAAFPAFADKDLKDITGKPLSLDRYKGKVVLVDFWATWCIPCLIRLPDILSAYGKYHDKGFEVVGVSLDEELDTLQRFIKERNMPWAQYCDGKKWDNQLALQYGIEVTPTTYLLDREGKIVGKNLEGEDLDKAIAAALAGK